MVLKIAKKLGNKVYEKKFKLGDVLRAEEAFITSTTKFIQPVVKINSKTIGNGSPGPVTMKLREAYFKYIGL